MIGKRGMAGFAARVAVLALPLVLAVPPSMASQRAALVIGNAAYAHAPRLANPLHDAADIGTALERLGFAVTRLVNADQETMRRALHDFAKAASASEVAVVFYAGHGIEVDGRNFLVPVDARLLSDGDVEFETVPLELVSRAVERARGLRLVILDACRENPFAALMQRAGATRSVGRGLARVEPSGETLVAYAAKEGTVAADGRGRNSPYSAALLTYIGEPGLEIGLMFRKVRDAVLAATGGAQEPFIYGSLSSRGVYLAGAPEPAAPSAASSGNASGAAARLTAEQLAAERLFWETVKDSADPAELEAYRKRYPEGTYAVLAASRLERLRQAAGEPGGATIPDTVGSPAPFVPAARPSPEAAEASLGLGRSERRAIQAGLASLGYEPGPADGLFGRRTRAALAAWQAARGEAATGWLVEAEAAVLKAAGEEALRVAAEARRKERERAEAVRKERAAAALRAGRVFRDCERCPEMVVVPAGSFMMGSPAGEVSRHDDEGPQRRVKIAKPFAVGKYEVMFSEWDACVASGGCDGYRPDDRVWGRGQRPVVKVSWKDAQAYVGWLSRKTGKAYRLLTESEWEYAARAGTRTRYSWGDLLGRNRANCRGCGSPWDGRRTAPTGSFAANGFGLHDMHGNVWEWVEDCWHDSYEGAPSDGRAWTGGYCGQRVVRGGSWNLSPGNLRSAIRYRYSTGHRLVSSGFRVVRTLTP